VTLPLLQNDGWTNKFIGGEWQQGGMRIAEGLESGMVGLNRGLVSDPSAPFSGVTLSGLGREGGHEGMLENTEATYIATSW
jgi:succinate-semialdehyde dehydrogenase/glutarate-semialdehyde dehydrogenase